MTITYSNIALIVLGVILLVFAAVAITAFVKNRQIADLKNFQEKLTQQNTTNAMRTEETYLKELEKKDAKIKELNNNIEDLKQWQQDIYNRLAEFKGSTQGSPERLIFKLIDHNRELHKAQRAKWSEVKEDLISSLETTAQRIQKMLEDAEQLHRDGIEVIAEYESLMPDDMRSALKKELKNFADSSKLKSALKSLPAPND